LLEMLVKNAGGHSDFMGCFVSGYAESCERTRATLLDVPPENGKRVLLYICPECGDVGCGAYSALVRRDRESYVWENLPTRRENMIRRYLRLLDRFFSNQINIKPACSLRQDFDGPE
jgi:hypothetical protein